MHGHDAIGRVDHQHRGRLKPCPPHQQPLARALPRLARRTVGKLIAPLAHMGPGLRPVNLQALMAR
ncbi:hypothetical protein RZS08_29210, partial [Arthrospira platensis SPKY1]|nr:hypothetical protein [Arthrospira platensis SPKY1]